MLLLFLLFPSIPQIETYFLLLTGYILLQRAQIPHPLSSCLLAESSLLPLLVLLFQTDALRYISSVPFSPCLVGILFVPPSSFQNATSPFSLSLVLSQDLLVLPALPDSTMLLSSPAYLCWNLFLSIVLSHLYIDFYMDISDMLFYSRISCLRFS